MALVVLLFCAVILFVFLLTLTMLLENTSKLLKIAVIFIILFLTIVGLTLCRTLVDLEKVDDSESLANFGAYVGGILTPLISGFAVFAAGFAFYAQYQANRQVQKQFKVQKFESQFYERFRLIKNEINSTYLPLLNDKTLSGRKVFYELDKEIKYIYFIISSRVKYLDKKTLFKISYAIFFSGKKSFFSNKNNFIPNNIYQLSLCDMVFLEKTFDEEYQYFLSLRSLDINDGVGSDSTSEILYLRFHSLTDTSIKHLPFKGMQSKLSIVFRQIFSLVKFVTMEGSNSYEVKRNYLRVLRSILSNYEQLHIFYNWYAGVGSRWENDQNRFLTDFRMIHNLPDNFLIEGIKLDEIFDLDIGYLREKNRLDDLLFEFQQ